MGAIRRGDVNRQYLRRIGALVVLLLVIYASARVYNIWDTQR